jgi:hypothetical protein
MRHDLRITKGNQYDGGGYYIEDRDSTLYAFGEIGPRMDETTGITWGGTYRPQPEQYAQVEAVIRQVINDGVTRDLIVGDDFPPVPAIGEWRSQRGLTLNEEMEREDTIY